MKQILLEKVQIVDPQSEYHGQQVNIQIEAGIITHIDTADIPLASDEVERIHIAGLHVSPGWLDMHVQLADPGYEWKESLTEMAQAAVKGGFTGVLAYPNTQPVIDNSYLIESIRLRTRHLPIEVHLAGSISEGGAGKEMAEMYDMHKAGALAFTDGNHPLQNGGLLMRALLYNQSFDGLLIQYPTDNHLVGEGQMHEGVVSVNLGMKGIPSIAERLGTARDLRIHDYAGGRIHFHPITTGDSLAELDVVRQTDERISLGTNISYIAAWDENLHDFDTNYKTMPPLRSRQEADRLVQAIAKGQVQVLASGHNPQGSEEKKLQFEQAEPGMLGLQTAFSLAYEHLVVPGHISLGQLIELFSHNPRRLLGLESVVIKKGSKANLSLFCPKEEWTLTASQIPSQAKNSPFLGRPLQGKVAGVIHRGYYYPA